MSVLRKCGYTGKIYIVVDDEDETLPDYIERYGNDVHVFHKEENFDTGDLGGSKGIATFARNECRKVAVKNDLSNVMAPVRAGHVECRMPIISK